MKMGPEEEFKLHNEQNSWPILFEVSHKTRQQSLSLYEGRCYTELLVIVQDEMSFCWIIMIILLAATVNYQKNILIQKK